MNEVNETNICLCGAPVAPGEHHCGECGASPTPDSVHHPFRVRDLRAMFDGITDEQVNAIRAQANAYDEAWVDADGLESIRRGDGFAAPTDGNVSVAFAYNALNGELGLEVTVFAADGTVTSSQDFG